MLRQALGKLSISLVVRWSWASDPSFVTLLVDLGTELNASELPSKDEDENFHPRAFGKD